MKNRLLACLALLALSTSVFAAAAVQVFNFDGPGEGFNDPTAAAPVGGNPGVTVGQQRQIAFSYAAQIWGQQLTSSQIIRVIAQFNPQACSANSAVLGGAAPWNFYANFPGQLGAPGLTSDTFYPAALAEKLTNFDIGTLVPNNNNFELFAIFNSNLGNPGCLDGGGWYYGLDGNAPAGKSDLVSVLLHEFGHGLGFTVSPTSGSTGVRAQGLPSVWERNMQDLSTRKTWFEMTDAERVASAVNTDNLVWTGPAVTMAAQQLLAPFAELQIAGPVQVRGVFEAQPATFGSPLSLSGLKSILMPVYDEVGSPTDACEPLTSEPQKSVKNRIALIDRGGCTFTTKVKNAQDAGAIAVVIANNTPIGLPGMGGSDPSITIPSVGISQALGNALRALPQLSNPGRGGLPLTLRTSASLRQGLSEGKLKLYAPNPFQQGSSVSHWDTSASPSLLMEPFITPGLSQTLAPPLDLTFTLLQDIGW